MTNVEAVKDLEARAKENGFEISIPEIKEGNTITINNGNVSLILSIRHDGFFAGALVPNDEISDMMERFNKQKAKYDNLMLGWWLYERTEYHGNHDLSSYECMMLLR